MTNAGNTGIYSGLCICIYRKYMYIYIRIYIYTHVYFLCVCKCTYMYACMYVHTYTTRTTQESFSVRGPPSFAPGLKHDPSASRETVVVLKRVVNKMTLARTLVTMLRSCELRIFNGQLECINSWLGNSPES